MPALITIPAPIKSIFTTFPLQNYDPVSIKDSSLENELNKRSFFFVNGNGNDEKFCNEPFTLLIKENPINWNQSDYFICSEPTELFIQLSLSYKNHIQLPKHSSDNYENSNLSNKQKMIIVNRPNLPSLIIKNKIKTKDEILSNLKFKFIGIQTQLAQLLDKDLQKMFDENILTSRSKKTLFQLENYTKKFLNNSDIDILNYLNFKIASYVLLLIHSEKISNEIKCFLNESCPKLKKLSIDVLKTLNPQLID